jgi:hypothetical protein
MKVIRTPQWPMTRPDGSRPPLKVGGFSPAGCPLVSGPDYICGDRPPDSKPWPFRTCVRSMTPSTIGDTRMRIADAMLLSSLRNRTTLARFSDGYRTTRCVSVEKARRPGSVVKAAIHAADEQTDGRSINRSKSDARAIDKTALTWPCGRELDSLTASSILTTSRHAACAGFARLFRHPSG